MNPENWKKALFSFYLAFVLPSSTDQLINNEFEARINSLISEISWQFLREVTPFALGMMQLPTR